ncbi:MAG TPA: 2Fe-2S iron-sulfur cluster binding domain-containing protein [Gammaproteobacteria bacterium]|nr:2Fe-2S iron-sulfur cluster binding domain-containing protein [Gammaproteobacteria bacterium]
MSKINFKGKVIECLDSETVLDAFLRSGENIPHSCKTGVCQTCLLRTIKGKVPIEAQYGLKTTLCAQNYFLACSAIPDQDLVVALPTEAEVFGRVTVQEKELLSTNICRLTLETTRALHYHAGQFINLRRDDNLIRSYSLLSVPDIDPYLEIHIKRMPDGKMSNWIFDQVKAGFSLDIQGPNGNCFYVSGEPNQNLLLIGTGTGLAPLIGIARDALYSGHLGGIYLYHGSRQIEGLYLHNDLHAMEKKYPNFYYIPCLSGSYVPAECTPGRAHDVALTHHNNLNNWRIYLCGTPPMVNTAKKLAYLAGADLADIYADPFEVADLRSKPRGLTLR